MNKKIEELREIVRFRRWMKQRWEKEYKPYLHENEEKRIILVCTPEHGNLGDQALALAEYNLINSVFEGYSIIEMPAVVIREFTKKQLKKIVGKAPVLVSAGGFIGTLWIKEENALRRMLQLFPNNKIMVFPQTVTFSEDAYGEEQKEISKKIYGKCKDIHICVREENSKAPAAELVGEDNILLAPDMVIGCMPQMDIKTDKREGCLLCLREDVEKILKDEDIALLEKSIKDKFPEIRIDRTDTVLSRGVRKENRYEEVKKKLQEFAAAEFVITDRLHGMLFAAITQTPCIVMNNSNGKVAGVYRWVKNLPYLYWLDNLTQCSDILDRIDKSQRYVYPFDEMSSKYEELVKLLEKMRE